MILRIFAKLNTDEKVAVVCSQSQVPTIRAILDKQFGGDWLFVDEVTSCIEAIKFKDGDIYKGFEAEKERYSKNIIQVVK